MSGRSDSTALFGGTEPVLLIQPTVVEALGRQTRAVLIQQLHWASLSSTDPGGWVERSAAEWLRHVGLYDRGTINREFGDLEQLGVVEAKPGRVARRIARRIRYDALADLVGCDLHPKAIEHAERCTADVNPAHDAPGGVAHDAPGKPAARRSCGSTSRLSAVPLEEEEEREAQEQQDTSPQSSAADVAFQPIRAVAADEQVRGWDWDHLGDGAAPRWTLEHALRAIAKASSNPTRCTGLAADFAREHEPRDRDAWVDEFAGDFPGSARWAVKCALKYVRGAPRERAEKVRARLAALAWRKQNGAAA